MSNTQIPNKLAQQNFYLYSDAERVAGEKFSIYCAGCGNHIIEIEVPDSSYAGTVCKCGTEHIPLTLLLVRGFPAENWLLSGETDDELGEKRLEKATNKEFLQQIIKELWDEKIRQGSYHKVPEFDSQGKQHLKKVDATDMDASELEWRAQRMGINWAPPLTIHGEYTPRIREECREDNIDKLYQYDFPGVYVLECSAPETRQKAARRADDYKDYGIPGWLDAAYRSEGQIYVGESRNIGERIVKHMLEKTYKTHFTHIFTPVEIIGVEKLPGSDEDEREEREEEIANKYAEEYPDHYIYYN